MPNLTTSSVSEKWVLWEHEKFFTRPNSQLLGHVLPLANVTPFSLRAERPILHQLTHAKLSGTVDLVLQLLQKIDPGVETLEILYSMGSPSLYLQHRETGFAPVGIFGDGLQRSLAIALSALSTPNGILLIDEVEAGLHTSILKDVFAWLVKTCQEYHIQLFVTTHSLETIDAVLATVKEMNKGEQGDTSNIVAYRLPSPTAGNSLKRFNGDLLYRLRYDHGLEVR
jgi:predicted ATP-dependent endonuclease of OLD family